MLRLFLERVVEYPDGRSAATHLSFDVPEPPALAQLVREFGWHVVGAEAVQPSQSGKAAILSALREAKDYLDDRADTVDHPDGSAVPNQAAHLAEACETAITLAEKLPE